MADERPPSASLLQGMLSGQPEPTVPAIPEKTVATASADSAPNSPEDVGSPLRNLPPGVLPPGVVQPQPEYLILEWVADSRVHRIRTREYYSSLAVIVLLLALILFFAGQTLLIFVLLAFLFVSYVLATTRPIPVINQITTYGIRYQGKLYFWNQLGRFWARDNHGVIELHVEAPTYLGNELILLPSNAQSQAVVSADQVADILRLYLINEMPPMSQIDRWVRWLEDKFPLEASKPRPTPESRPIQR